MIKPISQPFCCGALNACLGLQMNLLKWLCAPSTAAAHVTKANLAPPVVPTQIEADWLWSFLHGRKKTRLKQAQTVARMPKAKKRVLLDWAERVVAVADQFKPTPSHWPTAPPAVSDASWAAFKGLMDAFYEQGLKRGLPYKPDGTPVATGGVRYSDYVEEFRKSHQPSPNPDAEAICVLCGGPLGDTPHVDHWINKGALPILSVLADNLLAVCATCNEAPNKGEKDVHSSGSFSEWFHPYFRPASGNVRVEYVLRKHSLVCVASTNEDRLKADNLDALLNLSKRWTRKFKALHVQLQDALIRSERRRLECEQPRHSYSDIVLAIQNWQQSLSPSQPHYEVHQALATALQEPSRLQAWQSELLEVSI
jgi:hypothetical protein